MRSSSAILLVCGPLVCAPGLALAETLPLKNGTSLEGRVLSSTPTQVVIQWGDGQRTIFKADLAAPAPNALEQAAKALAAKDVTRAADLSRQVLIFQPESEKACQLWKRAHAEEIRLRIGQLAEAARFHEAYRRLSAMVGEDDLPLLYEALESDPSARARRAMAWLVSQIGAASAAEPLVAALAGEKDELVRCDLAQALGELDIGGTSSRAPAVAALTKAMERDASTPVRLRAAEALNVIATTEALVAIQARAAREGEPQVKAALSNLVQNPGYKVTRVPPVHRGETLVGYLKGTRYVLYISKGAGALRAMKLLVSVHGTDGSAEEYAGICREDAYRCGLIVLAPQFDHGQFPSFGTLNVGPRRIRADLRLLEIVDDLQKRLQLTDKSILLFGHSEGGQFVERFVLAHPERVARAAACGCGQYTLPDPALTFPDGLKPNPFAPDLDHLDFARLVQTPLAIVMGTKDEESHVKLAQSFTEAMVRYATERNLPCRVKLLPVVDGGHSGASNWSMAGKFLLAEHKVGQGDDLATAARKRALEAAGPRGVRMAAYVNCGEQDESQNQEIEMQRVRGHPYVWTAARHVPGAAPMLASCDYDKTEIAYVVRGLDRKRRYKLGLSWWDFDADTRTQRVVADSLRGNGSVELIKPTPLPSYKGHRQPAGTVIADIPAELTAEGGFKLSILKTAGPNAVVSELWLLENQ